MRRVDAPEILDSDACSPAEVQAALKVIGRINRRFGGISTTQEMIKRVADATGGKHFSLLEVAAGSGELSAIISKNLARQGIELDITLLDAARSHLPRGNHSVVADALQIPFPDEAFDLVACNLFTHHLSPKQLTKFVSEGLRVSRRALLINDLVRHPLHLGMVFISYPIMRSRVAWLDGLTSVRRAYTPEEILRLIEQADPANKHTCTEIHRRYLFRMGVIIWKTDGDQQPA
jgi:ubiquinone/menaquinone biosynthesis C-methylase UbiE